MVSVKGMSVPPSSLSRQWNVVMEPVSDHNENRSVDRIAQDPAFFMTTCSYRAIGCA